MIPYDMVRVKMMVICDFCGKLFSKNMNDIKKTNHNFCDKNCYHDYRKKHKYNTGTSIHLDKIIKLSLIKEEYDMGKIDIKTAVKKFNGE